MWLRPQQAGCHHLQIEQHAATVSSVLRHDLSFTQQSLFAPPASVWPNKILRCAYVVGPRVAQFLINVFHKCIKDLGKCTLLLLLAEEKMGYTCFEVTLPKAPFSRRDRTCWKCWRKNRKRRIFHKRLPPNRAATRIEEVSLIIRVSTLSSSSFHCASLFWAEH